jgi:hypothetical protein
MTEEAAISLYISIMNVLKAKINGDLKAVCEKKSTKD